LRRAGARIVVGFYRKIVVGIFGIDIRCVAVEMQLIAL
jgi:hypothetical protein